MNKQQLEIQFDTQVNPRPLSAGERRRRRALWWFGQMRMVVANAIDWRNHPPAKPEQVYFTLTSNR